jgi:hypothetical protein
MIRKGGRAAHSCGMWSRRKPSVNGTLRRRGATTGGDVAEHPGDDTVSLLEWYFPGAVEEHPAKRRIRRANQLANEMRETGGRHRIATD